MNEIVLNSISVGSTLEFDLKPDVFFYHSSSENNLIFDCEYISPIGEVNLKFPDVRCEGFDLLVFGSGEYASIDELTIYETYYAYSGNSMFLNLDTYKLLDSISSYSGEDITIALSPTRHFSIQNYSGETLFPFSLVISSIPTFSLSLISGESLTIELTRTLNLEPIGYTGQYLTAELELYAPIVIDNIIANSGNNVFVAVQTSLLLSLNFYSGEVSTTTLAIYPSTTFDLSNYSGNSVALDLTLYKTFGFLIETGTETAVDIEITPNLGFQINGYSGNSTQLEISPSYNLPLFGYSGEHLLFNFNTEYNLSLFGYSGDSTALSLTQTLPIELSLNVKNGETLNFSISTKTLLPSFAYTGENFTVGVSFFVSSGLQLDAYTGTETKLYIQLSQAIPINPIYTDSIATISITNEQNWHFYSGELLNLSLTTSYSFNLNITSGEILYTELMDKPSKPISLSFYSGENVNLNLKTAYSATFGVYFHNSLYVQVDIDSTTYFDLSSDSCCGPRPSSNNLIIEIGNIPNPESVSFGNNTYCKIELATAQRFSINAYTGNAVQFIDSTKYFEFDFYHGETTDFNLYIENKHKLCKGQFIPNGNWLVVEMTDLLDEGCYSDKFYSGETMELTLSVNYVLELNNHYTGEYFIANLTTDAPLTFLAFHGSRMKFDFPFEIKSLISIGEYATIKFYEAPINGYTGEYAYLTELVVEYGVRFTETGCFDNEFLYQNLDGDLITEMTQTVPIEGDPFAHSVKAKCF